MVFVWPYAVVEAAKGRTRIGCVFFGLVERGSLVLMF